MSVAIVTTEINKEPDMPATATADTFYTASGSSPPAGMLTNVDVEGMRSMMRAELERDRVDIVPADSRALIAASAMRRPHTATTT